MNPGIEQLPFRMAKSLGAAVLLSIAIAAPVQDAVYQASDVERLCSSHHGYPRASWRQRSVNGEGGRRRSG
jgi:hypothetical protein